MNGNDLRTAGMFQELGPIRSTHPQESIFSNVGSEKIPDVSQVVDYLRSGHILIDVMDVADDPFDASRQIMNGSTVLTDGDWLWRKDFAHFVQHRDVLVPDDLLTLIRQRGYVVPPRDDTVLTACSQEAQRLMFWNS